MNKFVKNWHLIILFSAIALSLDFPIGQLPNGKAVEIRFEDIFIVVLGLIWIFSLFKKRKIEKPPLFFPIISLLGFGFLTTFINIAIGYLSFFQGFFYFLKEVEIFLFYFYFYYHIKTKDSAKLIIGLSMVLIAINVIFVFFQTFGPRGNQFGEYGAAAIAETEVFPSGAFFLLFFIFLFNLFLYYFSSLNISLLKKWVLGLAAISPAMGVFASGSKTNFLAFILALFLTLSFLFLKKKSLKMFSSIILALAVISSIFVFIIKTIDSADRVLDVVSPIYLIKNFKGGRLDIIKQNLDEAFAQNSSSIFILGLGKGFRSEVHNQYARNFIETGIPGSILFLILVYYLIKESAKGFLKSKDSLSIGLSAGFLTATLIMLFVSFAAEAFIVVKPSEVYWTFTAVTMAVLSINKLGINKYDKQ